MFSKFFIFRPRFAVVISMLIVLVGLISMTLLPLEKYPLITPPQVVVRTAYPGANAEVIEETIAAPIESEINGVEDMLYMESSSSNGVYSLSVFFKVGTDPDMAVVNVQNRLSLATPRLPEEVKRQGLSVKQTVGGPGILVLSVSSKSNQYDGLFLHNFASIQLKDKIARLPGVAEVTLFGVKDYSMRIWTNPEKMAGLGLTVTDVKNAIRAQNVQVAVGSIGQEPMYKEQQFNFPIVTKGRFKSPQEFENIIIRANKDGSLIRLKDIAKVELGATSYSSFGRVDSKDIIALSVTQLSDANAIDVADRVIKDVEALSATFPEGIEVNTVWNDTKFIKESLKELVITLIIALLLVAGVTFVFLQNSRATLIPVIAIPVSVIGTFAALQALGFTINTLTMFGLVLAVGIVVDDAIVVIENVQRHLEKGVSPKEAALKTMQEVSGAIIATTAVLLAVFVPVAFLPGISGKLYKHFASSISIAVTISSLIALTLAPALCATIIKTSKTSTSKKLFGWFNRLFDYFTKLYIDIAKDLIKRPAVIVLTLGVLVGSSVALFKFVPTGFLPQEDQGVILASLQLPDGASLQRTSEVSKKVEAGIQQIPGISRVIGHCGWDGSNSAIIIAILDPWDKRTTPDKSLEAILGQIYGRYGMLEEGNLFAFVPPSITGLSMFGGFDFMLQDIGDHTPQELAETAWKLIFAANTDPRLQRVFTTYQANLPQVFIDVDREKALAQGVPISDIYNTLGIQLGSLYVNDFNKLGRVFQVKMQADKQFRNSLDDISNLYVRNKDGKMLPLNVLVDIDSKVGPRKLNRYNLFRSVSIKGAAAFGASSGEALTAMEELAEKILPEGYAYTWSGTSKQEKESSGQTFIILGLAIVFVYLFLVALYESWTIPFAVILVAPVAILGGLMAMFFTGGSLNMYSQIGLVMLIGMATKHAILIVEFAKKQREAGMPIKEAAITAAKLRFRAVMMTVLSFIFSIIPLVTAMGAGAESRRSIGIAVFGGMIAAAAIGTFLVPAIYALIQSIKEYFSSNNDNNDLNVQEGGVVYEKVN